MVQKCHVCMDRYANSDEHMPARCAFNKGAVIITFLKGVNGDLDYRKAKSGDGLYFRHLCNDCNTKTGAWYVESYGKFIKQLRSSELVDSNGNKLVYLRNVYPARILKEIYCMFLCAMPEEPPYQLRPLRDYILEKDAPLPDDSKVIPDVYLYWNASKFGRIIPLHGLTHLWQSKNQFIQISEISWPPLGIIYAFGYDDRLDGMEKLTKWRRYRYTDKINLSLTLPHKIIVGHSPLSYGNPWLAEEEKNRRGTVQFFHIPEGSTSLLDMGLTWKER